jgi:hypothetical protein
VKSHIRCTFNAPKKTFGSQQVDFRRGGKKLEEIGDLIYKIGSGIRVIIQDSDSDMNFIFISYLFSCCRLYLDLSFIYIAVDFWLTNVDFILN